MLEVLRSGLKSFNVAPQRREYTDLVYRFRTHLKDVTPDAIRRASIAEGAALIPLPSYRGVRLTLLDLCSLNATHTFKDWIACVTVAWCLQHDVRRVCFQSSANTGAALIKYASNQAMDAVWFYPAASRYKLDPALVANPHAILVEVNRPEPEVKRLVAAFSQYSKVTLVPSLEQQLEANKLRAHLLKAHAEATGESFDWQVQSLSSAFGPFGFYDGWTQLQPKGLTAPKLLGVHQSSTHPYATAFNSPDRLTADAQAYLASQKTERDYIEPTLFRSTLTESLVARMDKILSEYGGRIDIMTHERFARYRPLAMSMVRDAGLNIGVNLAEQGKIVENAGLIALASTLGAVDSSLFNAGDSILVAFTGGARPDIKGPVQPDAVIGRDDDERTVELVFDRIIAKLQDRSQYLA